MRDGKGGSSTHLTIQTPHGPQPAYHPGRLREKRRGGKKKKKELAHSCHLLCVVTPQLSTVCHWSFISYQPQGRSTSCKPWALHLSPSVHDAICRWCTLNERFLKMYCHSGVFTSGLQQHSCLQHVTYLKMLYEPLTLPHFVHFLFYRNIWASFGEWTCLISPGHCSWKHV